MRVDLSYFKASGKYYASASYQTERSHLWEIFAEVGEMAAQRRLPGLSEGGGGGFAILVDVPDHRNRHPHLVMPSRGLTVVGMTPEDFASLQHALAASSPPPWEADVDDPDTEHPQWTGKMHVGPDGESSSCWYDATPAAVADVTAAALARNAAPALLGALSRALRATWSDVRTTTERQPLDQGILSHAVEVRIGDRWFRSECSGLLEAQEVRRGLSAAESDARESSRAIRLATRAICERSGRRDRDREVELCVGRERTVCGEDVTLSVVGTHASWYVLHLLGADACVDGRFPHLRMPGPRIALDAGAELWCVNFDVVMAEVLQRIVAEVARGRLP